jgi:hypothetical protein
VKDSAIRQARKCPAFFMDLFPVTVNIQDYPGVKKSRCYQSLVVPEREKGGCPPLQKSFIRKAKILW